MPSLLVQIGITILSMFAPIGVHGSVYVTEVVVPEPAVAGENAHLDCLWSAGQGGYFTIRWYKDGDQLYSWIQLPQMPPIKRSHPIPGVTVEMSKCDERRVSLKSVNRSSEGVYRCEVMASAPTFQTSDAEARLTVAELPDGVRLAGLQSLYRVGDYLNISCIVYDARPKATIQFYINNKLIKAQPGSDYVVHLPAEQGTSSGLYTTRSNLVFPLGRLNVPEVKVACKALVHNLELWGKESVEVRPQYQPLLSFFNTGVTLWAFRPLVPLLLMMLTLCCHLFN